MNITEKIVKSQLSYISNCDVIEGFFGKSKLRSIVKMFKMPIW